MEKRQKRFLFPGSLFLIFNIMFMYLEDISSHILLEK